MEEAKLKKTQKQLEALRKQQALKDEEGLRNMGELGVEVEDDRAYTRGNSRKDKDVMPGRQGNFPVNGSEDLDDEEEGS